MRKKAHPAPRFYPAHVYGDPPMPQNEPPARRVPASPTDTWHGVKCGRDLSAALAEDAWDLYVENHSLGDVEPCRCGLVGCTVILRGPGGQIGAGR